MRKLAGIIFAALGLLALPGTASANLDCSYASGPSAGPVYLQAGEGGLSKPYDEDGKGAPVAVGACVGAVVPPATGGYQQGGAVEAGSNADTNDPEAYAVVDLHDRNATSSAGAGYVGVSNYESGDDRSEGCGYETPDRDTNSGGCIDGTPVPVPLACQTDPTHQAWADSPRDSCRTPSID